MAFTYTDRNRKVILHSWGRHKATVLAAVEVGDQLSRYDTSATITYRIADQSDGYVAVAVACQDGAAGEEITCALAAQLKAPTTLATGGVATQTYFAESADFLGAPLYLGESGKPQSSVGATTPQQVGYLLARDIILLVPNSNLTGQAGSFTTLTTSSTSALGGDVTVGSGKNLTMTKGTLTSTEGNVVLTKGNISMTAGDITITAGALRQVVTAVSTTPKTLTTAEVGLVVVDTSAADIELTLPTASAGLECILTTTSATKQLNIIASAGDKILNVSHAAKDSVKGAAAASNVIHLRALDATSWVSVASRGTWVYT